MTGKWTRGPRRPRRLSALAAAVAAAGLAALAAGCGGRTFVAGTAPFPAAKAVFLDGEGRPLSDLPAAPEPLKLVVLDFPWCPPCAGTWRAVRTASGAVGPGTVRIYRILFDRERFFSRDGIGVVPPLHPAAREEPPEGTDRPVAVTTLTAIPDAFRKEYEVEQAPLVLLLSAGGKVLRRWTGYSPSLPSSLEEELRRAAARGQDSSESPPL